MAASSYHTLLWQLPSPSPLPSVVGISEFLYYPISKLDFDYTQYYAITEAFSRAVRMLWKSTTTMQLFILAVMVLSLVYTTHNSRRLKRKVVNKRLRRKTSFKVEELYENHVLVSVMDVPNRQPATSGRSGKRGSPSPDGLVRREKMVHAEEVVDGKQQSRWSRLKTKMLLMARPPVGLLR